MDIFSGLVLLVTEVAKFVCTYPVLVQKIVAKYFIKRSYMKLCRYSLTVAEIYFP